MTNYNYNDGPECKDTTVSQFNRSTLGGLYSRDECRQPRIKKMSRGLRISGCLDGEVQDMLDKSECPICGYKPDPEDTLIYVNPHNYQMSWKCDRCQSQGLLKYDIWHLLPGYRRKSATEFTDDMLLLCVRDHNGYNINQLKDVLGWSYGKTRSACYRLAEKKRVRIENVHVNGYRESIIFVISPELN